MNPSFRGCPRSAYRSLLCGLLALAGLGLGACSSSVGSGVAPSYLVLTKPGTISTVNTLQMYECLTSGLSALMYFTNGSVGNFTGRVKWSSSDTGVVEVSNGDILIPDTTSYYPSGTLVPTHTGTAIVTANYYGIVSQTAITVTAPDYFKMEGFLQGSRVPLNLYNDVYKTGNSVNGNNFYMGGGTTLQLSAIASLSGVETDVSAFGTWGWQGPVTGATINPTTGVITASVPGSTNSTGMVPIITFPSCPEDLTNPIDQYTLTVTPVQSIALSPEYDPGTASSPTTALSLFVGNLERVNVLATLDNGYLQDVTAQSSLSTNGSTNMVFSSNGSGVNNTLDAVSSGNARLSATFSAGGSLMFAGYIDAVSQTGTLGSIYTCWSSPYVAFTASSCGDPSNPLIGGTAQADATVVAGSLTPVQYHAVGIYGTDSSGNALIQEVTRTTTWTADTSGHAAISNTAVTIGQATGVSQGKAIITATNSGASDKGGYVSEIDVQGTSGQTN
jgi:hypothetical protein